jgi:pyruvate dehydrogenase E2 component (dihydrolipoamide acetyltransferase)
MLTPVVMPKLGLTMQEGTVVEWRCAEGDSVRKGQVLLLIESEKVEFEVEAPADGVVRALITPEGETVPCRQVIAVLSDTADETFEVARFLAEAGERAAQESRTARAARREARTSAREEGARRRPRASPRARKLAEREGLDLAEVEGSGPEGRVTEDDVRRAVEALGERVTVDGARIGFSDVGRGETPLVFLIGFGLDRSGWNLQLKHFGESTRVLAPDPRGTGASSDPGDAELTVERLALDVVGLLDARGVDRADLVGSSLGCAIALEVALLAPERVRRLVLLSPAFETDARLVAALDSFCRVAGAGDPDLRLRVMAPWLFGPRFLADVERAERAQRAMIGAVRRIPERTLRRQAAALGSWLGSRAEALARVAAPALLVVGSDDLLTGPAQARALASALPAVRLELLEGVGHAPMVEEPERVHALIEQFLAE